MTIFKHIRLQSYILAGVISSSLVMQAVGHVLALPPSEYMSAAHALNNEALNAQADHPMVTGDGRYIAYSSSASNIVEGDNNNQEDTFLYDRRSNTTQLISKSGSVQSDGYSTPLSLSDDGRLVAIYTYATNLGGNPTPDSPSLYLRDTQTGMNKLIWSGGKGDGGELSRDGKKLLYINDQGNMIDYNTMTGSMNQLTFDAASSIGYSEMKLSKDASVLLYTRQTGVPLSADLFIYNYQTNQTSNLTQSSADIVNTAPDLSPDGRFISYTQVDVQRPLVPRKVYLLDTQTHISKLIKSYAYKVLPALHSTGTSVSNNGEFVAYSEVNNGIYKTLILDTLKNQTKTLCEGLLISCVVNSNSNAMSDDGSVVVFSYYSADMIERIPYYLVTNSPDAVAPSVVGSTSGATGANGWYKAPVSINWTATDPTPSSGAPTQPAATLANQEGAHAYTSGQSCDPAGNCATGSYEVKLDTVAPSLALKHRHRWIKLIKGTITGTVTDATSGIADISISDGKRTISSTNGAIKLTCDTNRRNCTWTSDIRKQHISGDRLKITVTDLAGNITVKQRRIDN